MAQAGTLADLPRLLAGVNRPHGERRGARVVEGADGRHRWADETGAPIPGLEGQDGFSTWASAIAFATTAGSLRVLGRNDPPGLYSFAPFLPDVPGAPPLRDDFHLSVAGLAVLVDRIAAAGDDDERTQLETAVAGFASDAHEHMTDLASDVELLMERIDEGVEATWKGLADDPEEAADLAYKRLREWQTKIETARDKLWLLQQDGLYERAAADAALEALRAVPEKP